MKVTILGCGPSGGVPLIGCKCPVCTSKNSKNNRTRSSIYIEDRNAAILVDTSPDLRQQALKNNITKVDAILYTHAHADHVMGIDETRAFNYLNNKIIDIYGDKICLAEIQERFSYIFKKPIPEYGWFRPSLNPIEIEEDEKFTVQGIEIQAIPQIHGKIISLGFRIRNFAYSTDLNELPDESVALLQGLDMWVIDCLAYKKMPTHSNLETTLRWIEKVKPKRAVLTHMNHEIEYEEIKAKLPVNVEPAYDGMVLEI